MKIEVKIEVKKVIDGYHYIGGPLINPDAICGYNDANGKFIQFKTVEDAFIYGEHYLYAYNVFIDNIVFDHELGKTIKKQLKDQGKINY